MAYPSSFMRLVVSGSLYSVESFSWGLSLIRTGADNSGTTFSQVPAEIIAAVQAFHQSSMISSVARLQSLKFNLIGTDGKYVSQEDTIFYDYPAEIPGLNNGSTPLPQASVALTLRTAVRRGLAASGRFYVPAPIISLGTDGRLLPAAAEAWADAGATLINAINTASPDWAVGVVSNVEAGEQRLVTRVECGRVVDTIRSRRSSLPEEHVPSEIAILQPA